MLDKIFRFILSLMTARNAYRAARRGRLHKYAANRALWKVNRGLFQKIMFK